MSCASLTLHTPAQVRAIDRQAIDGLGVAGYELMNRAGAAGLELLLHAWPRARRILVICGAGNNAGDGYVLARLARRRRLDVITVRLFEPARLAGDARQAWEDFAAEGGRALPWDESLLAQTDLLVDAIFGTGLSRPVQGAVRGCIEAINSAQIPVLALDVPSGLDAESGHVLGDAVRATRTLTFVARKVGFLLAAGPDHVGIVACDDLDLPAAARASIDWVARLIAPGTVLDALPPRRRAAHKGSFGHVLVVGGARGMPGAARLAGEAALRVGAGLVTVACASGNAGTIVASRPELMAREVAGPGDLDALLDRATVVAVGPGLATDAWAGGLLERVLASDLPLVVDADALNLLARQPRVRGNWILTPHPGEAGRLLETDAARIQADRVGAARSLVDRYGGVAVLKGAGTIVVSAGEKPEICDRGNPGMAAPGMGDVLTGLIAGIAAQCGDLWQAARAGVYVHAEAGDRTARERGERGLLASDLLDQVPTCLASLR
jgi:ADP-dependent NAD(P)H-hydrate dehydratase / NAD(P)H-hydrate epimerase